jgi:VTC domain-containing protein
MKNHDAISNSPNLRSSDIERTELKYAVSEETALDVLRWSRVFIKGDCISQRVTSLYLDTPTLRFLRWQLDGCVDRFKLRVRGYGDELSDRLYVEVKRKTGDIVRKQRAEIPTTALSAVLGATVSIAEQVLEDNRSEALRSFLNKRATFHAEPKILVSCQRQSLRESGVNGEVAVTVDRDIRYQQTCRRDLISDALAWRSVSLPGPDGAKGAIIELKYSSRPPQWLRTLTARLDPQHVNFSKYKAAMLQHAERNGYIHPDKPAMEYAGSDLRSTPCTMANDGVGSYGYCVSPGTLLPEMDSKSVFLA